jgi:acyl-CoA synthetase (AMP-forming)/AMP-acid ligase II
VFDLDPRCHNDYVLAELTQRVEGKELGIMYVVLREGAAATVKDLREYLAQHVAHYKIPRRILFTEDLPRTATGKIMKKELRVWYRDRDVKQ